MTPEELKRLLELCDAATPGPWEVSCLFGSGDLPLQVDDHQDNPIIKIDGECINPSPNCTFIAEARTAMPALLDEVERLTTENARCQAYMLRNPNILAEVEQENARLREALEEIVEYGRFDSANIAREALKRNK